VDSNGWIYVASDTVLAASVTTNFSLTVRTTDNRTPALSGTNTVALNLVEVGVVAAGQIQQEMFYNIGSGTDVASLTNNAKSGPGQFSKFCRRVFSAEIKGPSSRPAQQITSFGADGELVVTPPVPDVVWKPGATASRR
jgi:hypothetical protein